MRHAWNFKQTIKCYFPPRSAFRDPIFLHTEINFVLKDVITRVDARIKILDTSNSEQVVISHNFYSHRNDTHIRKSLACLAVGIGK